MPTLPLPPTLLGRISTCSTSVSIVGIPKSAVSIAIRYVGASTNIAVAIPSGLSVSLPVASLQPKMLQAIAVIDGKEFASNAMLVEDASPIAGATPIVPKSIGSCASCMYVRACLPGSEVRVIALLESPYNMIMGQITADGNGDACVPLNWPQGVRPKSVSVEMKACGKYSKAAYVDVVSEKDLSKPVVVGPLFACQTSVPLANVSPGTRLHLEQRNGKSVIDLGWICGCPSAVNVGISAPLQAGFRVFATHVREGAACKPTVVESLGVVVLSAKVLKKPKISPVLVEGVDIIQVSGLPSGSTVFVAIETVGSELTLLGPRVMGTEDIIALGLKLVAGQKVAVRVQLCGESIESDALTVVAIPAKIPAPKVFNPLFHCGAAVTVSGLLPGAIVRVQQDGFQIGMAMTGGGGAVVVPVAPTLLLNGKITATQAVVVGATSPVSSSVTVSKLPFTLPLPRFLPGITTADTTVTVCRVLPGSILTVTQGKVTIGTAMAGDPIVRVATLPLSGAEVAVKVVLCDKEVNIARVPLKSLEQTGQLGISVTKPIHDGKGNDDVDSADGTGHIEGWSQSIYMRSVLYLPLEMHAKAPLVVFAHGMINGTPDAYTKSYLGYDYLGRHLASWGIAAFSVNLTEVETQVPAKDYQNRVNLTIEYLRRLMKLPVAAGIDFLSLVFVGHSMGGKAVHFLPAAISAIKLKASSVRGVISLAPTDHGPPIDTSTATYQFLEVIGSRDQLLPLAKENSGFDVLRVYTWAPFPKTLAWIPTANHESFNEHWGEPGPGDMAADQQRRIARTLVTAFSRRVLQQAREYGAYFDGMVMPASLRSAEISIAHRNSKEGLLAVDNFGDGEPQLGLSATPPKKGLNRLGGLVAATDVKSFQLKSVSGLSTQDIGSSIPGSVLQLVWQNSNAVYVTAIPADKIKAIAGSFAISFRAARPVPLDTINNLTGAGLEIGIVVDDGKNLAFVRSGVVAAIPQPDTSSSVPGWPIWQTICIPFDAFQTLESGLDLWAIKSIWLVLGCSTSGDILIDDIDISRPT